MVNFKETDSQSEIQRRLQAEIKNYLNEISQVDKESEEYLEQGNFREAKPFTEEAVEFVEELIREHNFRIKQCYHNSQKAVLSYPEKLQYVEGYTISTQVPIPIQHAWVEFEGSIFEITLKHGPKIETNSVYFGKAYSSKRVISKVSNCESTGPLAGINSWNNY